MKKSELKQIHEKLRNYVMASTEPDRMSKQDALFILEELSTDIEGSIEALKEEIGQEG